MRIVIIKMLTAILLTPLSLSAMAGDRFSYDRSLSEIVSYFNNSYRDEIKSKKITTKWIFDDKRDYEAEKKIAIVSEALISGVNLEELTKFGLKKSGENSYIVSVAKDHNWLTLGNLFTPVKYSYSKETLFYELLDMGFDNADIQIFDVYITENNYSDGISKTVNEFRKKNAKQIFNKFKSTSELGKKSKIFLHSNESFRLEKYKYEKKWITELYRSLDKRAQRILLSFLSENISDLTFIDTHLTVSEYERQMEVFLEAQHKKSLQYQPK